MGPRLRQLLHRLIEPVPEPGAVIQARHRLSRPGQALVAASVVLFGLAVYGLSWGVTSSRARRFDFCSASSLISASVYRDGADTPPSRRLLPGAQAWTDPLSLTLLADLKAASRGQRLVLEQQIATLSLWIWRQCALVRNDHIQLVALSSLATAATALLVIAALVRLPKGLQDISRLEQAIARHHLAAGSRRKRPSCGEISESSVAGQMHGRVSQAYIQQTSPAEHPATHSVWPPTDSQSA